MILYKVLVQCDSCKIKITITESINAWDITHLNNDQKDEIRRYKVAHMHLCKKCEMNLIEGK